MIPASLIALLALVIIIVIVALYFHHEREQTKRLGILEIHNEALRELVSNLYVALGTRDPEVRVERGREALEKFLGIQPRRR